MKRDRKGLSNSVYAVVTLMSLIAGLMLLSNFGNPYSVAGQSSLVDLDNVLDDQDKLDISEETASKASKYISSNEINTSRITQNKQLMKLLSEQFSGLIKTSQKNGKAQVTGQKRKISSENISDSANQTQRTGNESMSNTDESNENTQSSSEEENKGKESDENSFGEDEESREQTNDTRENNSKTGGENGNQEEQKDEERQNNGINNSTSKKEGYAGGKKQNETEGLRKKLESSRNSSRSQEESTQSNGFLQESISSITSVFESGSENEDKASNEKTPQQKNQETQPAKAQNPQESSRNSKGLSSVKNYLILIAIPLMALLALKLYRSDKNAGEMLEIIIERLKNFVISLPDLFRRSVVEGVSLIYSRIKGLSNLTERMLKEPVNTLKAISSSLRSKLVEVKELIEYVHQRSLRENIDVLLEKEKQTYQGLDELWMVLRKIARIRKKGTLTPEEVKQKAVNRGMSKETVEKVVSAYRREKYSSEKVSGEVDLQKLKQEMQEGNDE